MEVRISKRLVLVGDTETGCIRGGGKYTVGGEHYHPDIQPSYAKYSSAKLSKAELVFPRCYVAPG